MTIFGRRLLEYVEFCRLFLGLILVIGIVRLALSLGGVPNSTATWFSVTAVVWIGTLYYSIRMHTSGFGSYKQLLVICVLQNLVAQAVIISGIVLAIVTGTGNIFSAPEYAFGGIKPGFTLEHTWCWEQPWARWCRGSSAQRSSQQPGNSPAHLERSNL